MSASGPSVFSMRCSRRCQFFSVTFMILTFTTLYTLRDPLCDLKSFPNTVNEILQNENLSFENLTVQSERWIIVEGGDVTKEELLNTQDVQGWTILVFGKNIRNYSNKRCASCIFINSEDMHSKISTTPPVNFKMAVYLYVINHGAKWIYITSQLRNLQTELDGFDFGTRSKGLFYGGQMMFDPERHFGVKDMSGDLSHRNQTSSYSLGDYRTPSIQSRWNPTQKMTRNSSDDFRLSSCRLPRVIVPSELFPISELKESLIAKRSFWMLGSFIIKSSFWTLWRVLLMRHLGEVIGSYPPSCSNSGFILKNAERSPNVGKTLSSMKCKEKMSIHDCGIFLAKELENRGHFTHSDVKFIELWFYALQNYKFMESELQMQPKETFSSGPVHRVIFEQAKIESTLENPFRNICQSIPHSNKTDSPISDVLLVVIFNKPTYYSNIVFLNYLYKQYFTHILYCGSVLGNFIPYHSKYPHPVSFMEINNLANGQFGYMCASYAMEMGYKVKGYLQMSDDVLLNMWKIRDLPRDKLWFQSSIRKGNLSDPKVPNITPVLKAKTWWPWASGMGVTQLRRLWAYFEFLQKTPDKPKVRSFLEQLSRSFGRADGAFYEASDIFYVPRKFEENFKYFSELCFKHRLYLEIAIPTMFCGFTDINNIVRLQGKYHWGTERKIQFITKTFNVSQHFLHPWKLQKNMVDANAQDFFCGKYLQNFV